MSDEQAPVYYRFLNGFVDFPRANADGCDKARGFVSWSGGMMHFSQQDWRINGPTHSSFHSYAEVRLGLDVKAQG